MKRTRIAVIAAAAALILGACGNAGEEDNNPVDTTVDDMNSLNARSLCGGHADESAQQRQQHNHRDEWDRGAVGRDRDHGQARVRALGMRRQTVDRHHGPASFVANTMSLALSSSKA